MSASACPYCAIAFTRVPKKRTTCAACGRPILVRKGRLYTEDEARTLDVCTRLGVPQARLDKTRELLSREFGRPPSAAEAAWRVMNELVDECDDHHARGMLYFEMARFVWQEGRDHLQAARECRRMQLANWKQAANSGFLDLRRARLSVITAGKASCPACRALESVEFTHQEALANMPIPVPGCTNEISPERSRGWCRCTYGLHP